MSVRPIPYDAAFEQLEPGEAETAQDMTEALQSIAETTFRDYGYPVRSLHAKSHGLLRGELQVMGGFAPAYAQGLFARPGRYPVVLRFSTNPGDLLDDSISVPRGLAMKVVGVEGERLPESEGQATQDFVLVNSPVFAVPRAKDFLTPLKLLAKTTDIPQGYKKLASTVLRGAETALEAVGGASGTLKSLGGHPNTHILGETFYSATPFLHGPYMAKYSVAPATPMLKALTGRKVDVAGRPDALREEVMAFFASQQGEWDLRVQLCIDAGRMPIEDASVEWPEELSPYVSVGRIIVPPQPSWDEARSKAVDLGMSFSPWHGLAAHRPLGSINRVRKPAYMMSSRFRAEHSGCPMREPGRAEEVPI